jgi:hypothetical protein
MIDEELERKKKALKNLLEKKEIEESEENMNLFASYAKRIENAKSDKERTDLEKRFKRLKETLGD